MPRSTPRPPALIVGVLAATAFVASLTQTLVIPILPTIPEQIGITAAQAGWLVTITVVVGAVSNPLLGRLGDQLGRRRILLVAVGAFVIGSIIPALSDNYALLLIGRGVQGISTAAIPLGIGIISAAVPKERRATGIATISATLGIGGALGLPLAGVISTAWGFHGLFWFATVAGVIAFVVAFATIPDVRFASTERGVDVAGAVLLAAGLSTLLLGISIGPGTGWGAPLTLGLLAVAVAAFAALVAVELRVRNPIVDVRLAVARTPLLTNLAGFFTGFAFFTGTLGIITIAQLPLGIGFGLAIFAAGLALLPGGLLMAAVSPISGRLVGRIGGRGRARRWQRRHFARLCAAVHPAHPALAADRGGLGVVRGRWALLRGHALGDSRGNPARERGRGYRAKRARPGAGHSAVEHDLWGALGGRTHGVNALALPIARHSGDRAVVCAPRAVAAAVARIGATN